MRLRRLALPFALALIVLTLACHGADEVVGGSSHVRVLLTDAPSDLIASAKVTVSRVYLVGGDGGSLDLMSASEAPLSFELLDLRQGVEALLADRAIPAATYDQLRLVVEAAEVTLADGVTFEDGTSSRTLRVPSGMQSGIKVQLAAPIDADPGELTLVVVDFDVDRNFVVQGNAGTPAGVQGVLFTPVLLEKRRAESPLP